MVGQCTITHISGRREKKDNDVMNLETLVVLGAKSKRSDTAVPSLRDYIHSFVNVLSRLPFDRDTHVHICVTTTSTLP